MEKNYAVVKFVDAAFPSEEIHTIPYEWLKLGSGTASFTTEHVDSVLPPLLVDRIKLCLAPPDSFTDFKVNVITTTGNSNIILF